MKKLENIATDTGIPSMNATITNNGELPMN